MCNNINDVLDLKELGLSEGEIQNIELNSNKNCVTIEDGLVYNKKVNNKYKKIDLWTAFATSIDPDKKMSPDWLFSDIYNKLGDYIWRVYCTDVMSIDDYIKVNTLSPKFLGNRSAFDFFYNLINSWYFEASIKDLFYSWNYEVISSGNDEGFQVVRSSKLRSDYDFLLINNRTGLETKVEFIDDFGGLTSTKGYIPLRENKLRNIKKLRSWIVILNHKNRCLYFIGPDDIDSGNKKMWGYERSHVVYVNNKTHIKSII